MWNATMAWQRVCSAIGLVGFLISYSGGTVGASARYDWCYNTCGSSQGCDIECENDGGGTITCGDYHGGAPEWCDADDCDVVCTYDSNPGVECVWLAEPTTCYDYGVYGYCGDDMCQNISIGEDCVSCENDCGVCPPPTVCGDDVCDDGETYVTCPDDCADPGEFGYCGDGVCSKADNEDYESCAIDCETPNERCEDDYDCAAGFSCVGGGQPYGGQCVLAERISHFAFCSATSPCPTGYVCRQIEVEPDPNQAVGVCVWWWAPFSR